MTEKESSRNSGESESDPIRSRPPRRRRTIEEENRLQEVADLVRGYSSSQLKEALVSMGFVDEEDLLEVLSRELRMERVNWAAIEVTPDLLAEVPDELAWRLLVFPVRSGEDTLHLALGDPLRPGILEELERELGRKVVGLLATEGEILRMLGIHY